VPSSDHPLKAKLHVSKERDSNGTLTEAVSLQKDLKSKYKWLHRCLATQVQHTLGLLDQELLLSHTLEVEHPHSRAILEPHPRAIQELHVLGIQEPLQVKDMGEPHYLSSRVILEVVPTLAMEEPLPHSVSNSLDMELVPLDNRAILEHNLSTSSKAILELHHLNSRATVLPLSSSRLTLKLPNGFEQLTKTGVDRLIQRSCRGHWSMATGVTSVRRHAG